MPDRFKKPNKNGSKGPTGDRFKKPNEEITDVNKTNKQQVVTAAVDFQKSFSLLRDAGFDEAEPSFRTVVIKPGARVRVETIKVTGII